MTSLSPFERNEKKSTSLSLNPHMFNENMDQDAFKGKA